MWRPFRGSRKYRCSGMRDALSSYMDGRLNPEDAVRVEKHLNTCRGCREDLESLGATVALLRRLPEVTPSRSFAVAPVRAMPGRRVLPALRFAAAGAALLLVLAFAADWTGLFRGGIVSNPRHGADTLDFGGNEMIEEGDSFWVVAGVKNTVDVQSVTPEEVELVVPDSTDNVFVAVDSLVDDGALYGAMESDPDEVPQIALMRVDEGAGSGEDLEKLAVVTASSPEEHRFSINDGATYYCWGSIIAGQDASYLNMLSSDNSELYSFNLKAAKKEVIAAKETDWLRPLEYSLIGLVAVLATATAAVWLRQRRARVAEVSENQN